MIQWDVMYLSARQWGIQPGEFWEMTMPEWYCEYDFHVSRAPATRGGKLTRGDLEEIEYENSLTDEEWEAEYGTSNA